MIATTRELAELLYRNKLKPVYHGEHDVRTLKELARSYLTITRDLTRVMSRLVLQLFRDFRQSGAKENATAPNMREVARRSADLPSS